MKIRFLLLACGASAVASCGEQEPTPVQVEPIVVSANYADEAYLPALFEAFTSDTGIRVSVRYADAERIVANVIEKRGSPPADVLLTDSVDGIWRAGDAGALLPLVSELVEQRVPAQLRGPDGYWTAIAFRTTQIVFDVQKLSAADFGHYEDLAQPQFRNKLCLSSSSLAVNRSLIANLIRIHGRRPAEIIIRGWMQNLALPPYKTESDLMLAIHSGTCAVGLVSSSETGLRQPRAAASRIAVVTPSPAHLSIEAAGVNRHARQPEAARGLVDWLVSSAVQERHAAAIAMYPANSAAGGQHMPSPQQLGGSNVASAAWLSEDAVKLAQRAAYR